MKKIWKILLVILVVVIAFYFPVILASIAEWMAAAGFAIPAGFVASLASIPWWAGAAVGVGLAYLIDPDTTSEIIKDAGDIVKDVAGAVGEAAGGLAGAFLSSPIGLAMAGLGLWLLLGRKRNRDQQLKVAVEGGSRNGS